MISHHFAFWQWRYHVKPVCYEVLKMQSGPSSPKGASISMSSLCYVSFVFHIYMLESIQSKLASNFGKPFT